MKYRLDERTAEPELTVSAPETVNGLSAQVCGIAGKEQTVKVYVNDTLAKTTVSDPYTGKYRVTVSMPEGTEDHKFIYCSEQTDIVSLNGQTVTAEEIAKDLEKYGYRKVPASAVSGDGSIDAADAQRTLAEYVNVMSGKSASFDDAQKKAADVDGNGIVSVEDAQNILKYYVQNTVAGKTVTWEDILKPAEAQSAA